SGGCRGRRRRTRAAVSCSGEHDEVRRRRHVVRVRHLLGRRRRRGQLAGSRPRDCSAGPAVRLRRRNAGRGSSRSIEGVVVITRLKGFARFWYDFFVGDDWTVAVGVVLALAATYALSVAGVNAWWITPAAVLILLAASVRRAARSRN